MEAKKEISFPQYRKYLNGKTFFKITSVTHFEELRWMGGTCIVEQFEVKILPDRNFIYDMLFDYEKNWLKISEQEYESVKE